MAAKRTIVYVMSDKRAGSTLLENILSKSDETVSVGELNLLKNHIFRQGAGFRWDWNCSCGKPIMECVFWSKILADIDINAPEFNTKIQWNFKSNSTLAGSVLTSVFKTMVQKVDKRKINKDTINTLYTIYHKIFDFTGKNFIIDSSKTPMQAYILYLHKPADIDVKIVRLKRDLRAIAVSKRKWNTLNNKDLNKSLNWLLRNSFLYNRICNQVLKLVDEKDKLLISYEELATSTQAQLDKVTRKTGLKSYTAPEYMHVEDDHTIAGTPQRFTKKPIRYDNSWEETYSKKPVLSLVGKIMNKL